MANIMIAWGNEADRATLSGGAWIPTLPRSNLQTRELAEVARTSSLDAAATQFTVGFGSPRPPIECIALVGHNMSPSSQWRITASNAAGTASETTGWMDVWPRLSPAELEWEDDRWWAGVHDAETIAQFTPLLVWSNGRKLWPSARYTANPATWRIELSDPANPAGYVQIGRLFIGRAFRPKFNYSWGASIGYETETTVARSLGGVPFFDRREGERVLEFRLGNLNDSEAYGAVLLMQRRVGVDGEVIVLPDPDRVEFALQRNIYGRFERLSSIENPHYQTHGHAYRVREIIA